MGSDYSDSDEDYRYSSRHKSKRHSRSRSSSRDRRKSSQKSKKSKHKRRSRSRSSEKRSRRRSRSRSSEYISRRRDRHRKSRSRSHSRSRSDHDSRSQYSRCNKKSQNDSRKSSRSRDSHKSRVNVTPAADTTDNKEMTNAQVAEKKLQKALKAAITADEILRAQGVDEKTGRPKANPLSFDEQMNRASTIVDIDSGEFVQETFKSTRSQIPLPSGSAVDASHSGAMFSSGPIIAPTQNAASAAASCSLPSYSNSIMHPNLYIGVDEKMERWKKKVIELRKQKLSENASFQKSVELSFG